MSLKLPPYPVEYLEINYIEEHEQKIDVKQYVQLQREQTLPFAASGIINSSLISAKRLTQDDDGADDVDVKRVMEICLNIEKFDYQYQPGDTVGILPENNICEVNEIIKRLKYDDIADKLFNISVINAKKKIPIHVPVIGTIRQLFTSCLDIRCVPKKLFLRALRKYTTNEEDSATLDLLCSQQGAADYSKFITEFYPLLELLKKFPSCYPPFTVFLEHLPRLLPRPYSIINSPNDFNGQIKLIFNETKLPKNYKGVCSSWLNNTDISEIPLYFRKPGGSGGFVLPEDKTKNLILIATGTGIAPFLSFLEHFKYDETKRKVWLFYGCRYNNRDFLYKHKLEEFLNANILTKLFKSFSRDRDDATRVKYVQDNIRLYSKEFVEFMTDAVVYVCGGKQMCEDVFEAITHCVSQNNEGCSFDEARIFMEEMKRSNRYLQDVWN